ncbi:hypothetical protein OCAE111667_21025 [Occultella aeris]|uniref:Uncharacterized protein n=1 Tax=Occultella aeris TaxID=2761496 RepID=A0A7M4DQU7_9MICO|nr:hypothetical protein [Occultella aeris]VZO39841.1 hypothetical protein HALOF300_04538 [Occultella aeris]
MGEATRGDRVRSLAGLAVGAGGSLVTAISILPAVVSAAGWGAGTLLLAMLLSALLIAVPVSLGLAIASPRGTRWRWAAVAVAALVVVLVLRPAVGSLDVLWLG